MIIPVPLSRPRHQADAPPDRPEEAPPERRSRQLAFLRELAELNMKAARAAALRVEQAGPEGDQADAATLSLARATRAVTTLFTIENRIADGHQQNAFRPDSPRHALLRDALHPLAKQDPDPARRAALRRGLDQAIDDALLADDDDEVPLADIAVVIARSFGLRLELATVTDELLGMPPRAGRPPNPFDHRGDDDDTHDLPRAPP